MLLRRDFLQTSTVLVIKKHTPLPIYSYPIPIPQKPIWGKFFLTSTKRVGKLLIDFGWEAICIQHRDTTCLPKKGAKGEKKSIWGM